MENDLFQDNVTTKTNIEDTDPSIGDIDYLSELVGEGKKFATPQDLAKGKYMSDKFIEQLKSELRVAREDAKNRQTVEQLIAKLDTRTTQENPQEPTDDIDRNPSPKESQLSDIEKLIEQKLSQRDTQRIKENNIVQVLETLKQMYGEGFASIAKQKLNELGLSGQEFRELSATNPKAALRLVSDPQRAPEMSTIPQSRVSSVPRPSSNGRTYKDYQKIKQANPSLYWSDAVQTRMHKDAMDLQEAFYN